MTCIQYSIRKLDFKCMHFRFFCSAYICYFIFDYSSVLYLWYNVSGKVENCTYRTQVTCVMDVLPESAEDAVVALSTLLVFVGPSTPQRQRKTRRKITARQIDRKNMRQGTARRGKATTQDKTRQHKTA